MSILVDNSIKKMDFWNSLPLRVWPALHLSFETLHKLRYFEPVKKKEITKCFTGLYTYILSMKNSTVIVKHLLDVKMVE